jgi:hypothetical protein
VKVTPDDLFHYDNFAFNFAVRGNMQKTYTGWMALPIREMRGSGIEHELPLNPAVQ